MKLLVFGKQYVIYPKCLKYSISDIFYLWQAPPVCI